jgi:hypothetical protein
VEFQGKSVDPVRVGLVGKGAGPCRARAVDQDIQPAERGQRALGRGPAPRVGRQVSGDGMGGAAIGFDPGRRICQRIGRTGHQRHRRAFGRQTPRDLATDPLARPGHERRAPRQLSL